MSAGRHFKAHPNARITEAEAKRTITSVKESSRQRNQDKNYGSKRKKDDYLRKRGAIGKEIKTKITEAEAKKPAASVNI